jgi:hypothetical protein
VGVGSFGQIMLFEYMQMWYTVYISVSVGNESILSKL